MKELDIVKLKKEFNGLSIATEGTIVLEYDGAAFEVEFYDENSDTIAVLTTPAEILEIVIPFEN